jgi:HD superfamily phosphodiesterase
MNRIEDNIPPKAKFTQEQKDVLIRTRKWAVKFFSEEEKKGRVVMGGHGFDHNQRVSGMAATLALMEKKDPFLPVLITLIYDIGRTSNDPRALNYKHGQLSREMSKAYIDSISLLSSADKELVKNAIEDHPLYNKDVRRNYVIEIVMDADRLDSIGALGPVRAGATRWKLPLFTLQTDTTYEDTEIKSIYQDFAFRVSRWYDSLWTKSAREIAKPRVKFLNQFIKEYEKEASFMLKAYTSFDIDQNR